MEITPKSFKSDYETTFILTPELSEEEQKQAAEKFVKLIRENDGEIINIEHWGMRKLAYSIAKHTNGYYTYVEFRTNGEFISRLEREYGYDDKIIRSLTVKLDKHAVAYNNKRREQGFGMRKELQNQ